MEYLGRDLESLKKAGAVGLFVGVFRRTGGSSKQKAKKAREAILNEFKGISDATLHELESEAFHCMDHKPFEG